MPRKRIAKGKGSFRPSAESCRKRGRIDEGKPAPEALELLRTKARLLGLEWSDGTEYTKGRFFIKNTGHPVSSIPDKVRKDEATFLRAAIDWWKREHEK